MICQISLLLRQYEYYNNSIGPIVPKHLEIMMINIRYYKIKAQGKQIMTTNRLTVRFEPVSYTHLTLPTNREV